MRNRDEMEGKVKRATGAAKDKAGEWTDNPDLEAEGEAEREEGKAREDFGKARRKVGEKIEEVGKKIGR